MITKISTNLPTETNKRIIDLLYSVSGWMFGFDHGPEEKNINKPDSGFTLNSYSNENSYIKNNCLYTYATVIMDIVNNTSPLKFKKLNRIYWNWYNQNSRMEFHTDDFKDNCYTILYNLHSNDGGTEFKVADKIDFYKSVESEALFFPSKIYHRGVAPKKNLTRFSLNILMEL
tara:strand:- start:979 stop:1497 length:519 start_codon:yes stop_codon:yes gene_type:complete